MKKIAFIIIALLSVQNVHAVKYKFLNYGVGVTHPKDPTRRSTISIEFKGKINEDDDPKRYTMNVEAPEGCLCKENKVVQSRDNIKTLTFYLPPIGQKLTAEIDLPMEEIKVGFGFNGKFLMPGLGSHPINQNTKKVILNLRPDEENPLNYPHLDVIQQ